VHFNLKSPELANSCEVVYYRSIFLISFSKEVFLRSVILFQSDSCFMRHENGQRLAGNVAYANLKSMWTRYGV
jgi:hypothetical protein